MNDQSNLIKFFQYERSVRSDRWNEYTGKVHQYSTRNVPTRSVYSYTQMLCDSDKFKEVCVVVEDFLVKNHVFLESLECVEDFSLIIFEKLLGYGVEEVIAIGGIENRTTYIANSNRLQPLFSSLEKSLYILLKPYKKVRSTPPPIRLNGASRKRRRALGSLDNSHVRHNRRVKRPFCATKQESLSSCSEKQNNLYSSRYPSRKIGVGYFPHIGRSSSSTSEESHKRKISLERISSSSSAVGRCRFCERSSMYGANVCYACNSD